MWSCRRRRPWTRLSPKIKLAEVTLQAISSILVGPVVPTSWLVTLTLGDGVRGPNRNEPLAGGGGGGGKSVGGDAAEELRILLGDLHDVLIDAEVCLIRRQHDLIMMVAIT